VALFCHHGTAGRRGDTHVAKPDITTRFIFGFPPLFLRCLDRLVNAKQAVRELAAAFPGRARAARGSWRRGVPRILLVAGARPRPPARNTVSLLRCPAQVPVGRLRRRCGGRRPRTKFSWSLPSSLSLRRCSAKHHRIGRVWHVRAPNMIGSTASIFA
jgi:hypothetical protein